MFKHTIDDWMQTKMQELHGVPEAQLDQLVSQALKQYPPARKNFQILLDQQHRATIIWSETTPGRELDFHEKRWSATLDNQAKLVSRQVMPSKLAELIDTLHRTAGIPGMLDDEHIGVYVIGIASVLYFLALVSGVILLLPTMVKDFFALRPGKNRKRFWLDAHNIVGITSLPFHLVICLTAIVFAFHDQYYDALNHLIYPSVKTASAATQPKKQSIQGSELLAPSILLEKTRQESNGAHIRQLEFMELESARPMLRVALYNPRYLVRGPETGYLVLNPYNGKPSMPVWCQVKKAGGWPSSSRFLTPFGSYGGDFMRWVYFFWA